MNKKELIRARTINKAKLEPSAWKNINRIETDIGNSVAHEISKCYAFLLLRNGVPAIILPEIFDSHMAFDSFDSKVEMYGQKYQKRKKGQEEWRRPVVVTEARFKSIQRGASSFAEKMFQVMDGNDIITRRADLFVLDTGEIVEIETDHKVCKEGAITVYI